MDKSLYEFFKELKFDDGEIEILISTSPTLDEIDISQAIANMSLVVEAGYPAEDIGYLISQNPGFLCRNTQDLAFDLLKLKQSSDDVEDALKNNPHII